jgi:nucleotide-binding universal stress UspA family protein
MKRTPTIFRSILCPVDFSTHSRAALRHAVATADRFGGRVTAIFVNDPILLAAASRTSKGRRQFVERTRLELTRFVTRAIATPARSNHTIAIEVASGNPAEEILRAAKRLRSDLVVIGTQGLSGFRKVFFGSTTAQILGQATLPVLAIPPTAAARTATKEAMGIRRIVAPLDLAGEWQSDVVRAASVAAAFDAELVLVHVLAEVQTPPWLRSTTGPVDRRRTEAARQALERVKHRLASDLNTATRVLVGNPAHEIAQLTVGSPTLVVMSLRGGAGVWGARRGAIAYHLLTHSSTPVLALPRRRLGGRFAIRLSRAIGHALSERDRIEMAGIDALMSSVSMRRRPRRS